ncbi:MAG: c-type cytochrome [Chloroflexota bacterium]
MSDFPTISRPRRTGFPFSVLILGVMLGGLLTGLVGAFLAVSSLQRRVDLPMEQVFAGLAKDFAIPQSASRITPPGPLDDRRALARGREAFNGSCAVCHGADGSGQGRFGAAMYPPASDLRAASVQKRTDGQLFWIVQHGLSFVGMPGFSEQYGDEATWAIIGYLRALGRGDAPAGNAAPVPTDEQLAIAHPFAAEAERRGAAVFFEQGCHLCHGPRGDAVGNMALRPTKRSLASEETFTKALREPPLGMPQFAEARVDQREVADLLSYIQTLYPRA